MFPGATPMVPCHHPVTQMTIASSNFTTPAAIPDCLAGPGHIHHSLNPLFTFIFTVNSPNSTCPFLPPFPLLFLQAPHYPLSAFLTRSSISQCLFNVISFFLLPRHLLLPFANVNSFFFLTWMKPHAVWTVPARNLEVMDWWISDCVR